MLISLCKTVTNKKSIASNIKGYKLIWLNEFNGSAVETTNWNFEIGGEGWGNHKQEYYQPANATIDRESFIVQHKNYFVTFYS